LVVVRDQDTELLVAVVTAEAEEMAQVVAAEGAVHTILELVRAIPPGQTPLTDM
jgi:hypothetical protein